MVAIKTITIHYLSHGKHLTGGYLHELFLLKSLENDLTKKGIVCKTKELRRWQFFEGFFGHIKLLIWAFRNGNANINITVSRLAFPVIFRNLLNKNKTLIVWHYFDPADGRKLGLRFYYSALLKFLKITKGNGIGVITVANYWKNYFSEPLGIPSVFLFPNFFPSGFYQNFKTTLKENTIHLGQVSFKNDAKIFDLARKLNELGYQCYFSTNDPELAKTERFYQIEYFEKFEDYLRKMAQCNYTLGLSNINEGWNRVVHESLLVGTQVIGYHKGGLGELLQGANALIAKDCDEVFDLIKNKKSSLINDRFLENYEENQAGYFIGPIAKFAVS